MNRRWKLGGAALGVLCLVAGLIAWAAREDDLRLTMDVCGSCHSLEDYVSYPRSAKSWELTVYRMQMYGQQQGIDFSDQEADRIVAFLATDPPEIFGPPEDQPVVAQVEPNTPAQPRPAMARMAPAGLPGPSRATNVAKIGGYAAVFFAVGLTVTGFVRRPLKRAFKPVHHGLALALFVTVALHAVVYISEYGAPLVSWLWMGIVSTAVLVAAELVGLYRKPLRRSFLTVHVPAGLAGLGLALLHWVWAYLF